MSINLWRVATRNPTSPAHLIARTSVDGGRIMACQWIPTTQGLIITEQEMVATCRFACGRCLRAATGRAA